MASSGVNVLRYSALLGGILYGFQHQRTIYAKQHAQDVEREYQSKESLIAKAKAAYLQKSLPPGKKTAGGDGTFIAILPRFLSICANPAFWRAVISDPDDPKFDLEAYLTLKMADEAK
ncbi:hypothetical protein MMC25_007778 [Agyrium rufum]|nr:hypothetical protein [Agyrium rufum]